MKVGKDFNFRTSKCYFIGFMSENRCNITHFSNSPGYLLLFGFWFGMDSSFHGQTAFFYTKLGICATTQINITTQQR